LLKARLTNGTVKIGTLIHEQFDKLRKAVLEKLLNGKAEIFQILFKQYLSLQVVNRELQGLDFGRISQFRRNCETSGSPSFWFGDVHAKMMV